MQWYHLQELHSITGSYISITIRYLWLGPARAGAGACGEKDDTGDTGGVGQQGHIGPQGSTDPRGSQEQLVKLNPKEIGQ